MTLSPNTPPSGTLRDWLETRAQAGGTAVVFPETDETLSWADLQTRAHAIATHLTSLGIPKGQSVAIMMPNGRAAVECLYGVLVAGFRATMINLVAGPEAIGYAFEHSEARHAFVHDSQMALFTQAAGHLPITCLGSDVVATATKTATKTVTDTKTALHPLAAQDHALLMYTSGTTGQPKGVVHTHASLLAGGWTTAIAHALTPQDRGLCVLPIYHINGLCVSVMGSLVSGGSLAMCTRFSNSGFWTHVDQAQATWFSVVPTIISHLLQSEHGPSDATRARLRFGRSASAPLAPEVQQAFETRFDVPIIETMGLTETAAQILSNPLPPGVRKIGSPGVACGNEACILGPDFTALPANQEGEIAIRGPNVMLEYLKNPDATQGTFTPSGWFRTGDLGRIDADGYVYVTGRLKELIIKGGENIAPREIDEALYSHADVVEAAAYPCPCPRYGERIEAAVALSDGSAVTEDMLLQICTARLGTFKSPDRILFLDELPKGPSGKIQRRKLSEMAGAGAAA
ncbi:MAG: AMP-binding protein [Roseovarius sp.]